METISAVGINEYNVAQMIAYLSKNSKPPNSQVDKKKQKKKQQKQTNGLTGYTSTNRKFRLRHSTHHAMTDDRQICLSINNYSYVYQRKNLQI